MIRIDGSEGEGGGQILRTALALSILTDQPFQIVRIRAGRRNPGLAPQHLAGVLAAARICDAEVEGAHLGSGELIFRPGRSAAPGRYTFDISQLAGKGSAGAVTLLLQAILLPLALAAGPSHLTLRGGTHVAWSPPVHYVEWVLLPTLAQAGLQATIRLLKWGWYPRGGGEVEVTIQGQARLRGLDLVERGQFLDLRGLAVATNLPAHIPQRISGRLNNLLRAEGLPPRVQPLRTTGPSTGAGVFVSLSYENVTAGFSALGERGKPSEKVANEAAAEVIAYHRQTAALDPHLPDQLLPVLALAGGPSALSTQRITRHVLTNVAVIGRFVERPITVEGNEGEPGLIRVAGDAPVLPSP